MDTNSVDFRAITDRQQKVWATGDFHELARQTMAASEKLCEALDPHAGQRVLDVACGSGNAALVAARRYCEVTGLDYVPALIERAKVRAAAEGVEIDFHVGDAQALPFPAASFDVVLSVFGVMFAPDQEQTARELMRVCRPGGTIGLSCWMPEGFGGALFKTQARYVPPPAGLKPPVRWGTDAGLAELFGDGVHVKSSGPTTTLQYFRSVDHAVDVFRTYFGPANKAFQTLDAGAAENLRRDMAETFTRFNRATDGTLVLEATYLQAILEVR